MGKNSENKDVDRENKKGNGDHNRRIIVGKVDPSRSREELERKTKKKVVLISPQPKKEPDTKRKEPKQAPQRTVVLKLRLGCQGCVERIRETVEKTEGVEVLSIDEQKELVTVTGSMDVKALREKLKKKLKREVEIVSNGENKDDLTKKKKKKDSNVGVGGVVEGIRIEYMVLHAKMELLFRGSDC